jgi:hypothetical protein
MSTSYLLSLTALIASIMLLLQNADRVLALVALALSGVEVLLAFGIVHLSVRGLPLGLILGAALAVVGVLIYTRVHGKGAVSAATLVAFVGIVQVLAALHLGSH